MWQMKKKKKKKKDWLRLKKNELTTHPGIYKNKTLNKQVQVNTGIFFNLNIYEI